MDKGNLYQSLFKAYKDAYPDKKPAVCQSEFNQEWFAIKNEKDCESKAQILFTKWASIAQKKKAPLKNMFAKQLEKNSKDKVPANSVELEFNTDSDQFLEPSDSPDVVQQNPGPSSADSNLSSKPKSLDVHYKTPVQTEIKSKIDLINSDLVGLLERERRKMLSTEQEAQLSRLKKEKSQLEKKLQDLTADQERQRKRRAQTRETLIAHPELKKKLKMRDKVGRPCLQEDQPLLLQTIIDLATCKSSIIFVIYI